MKKIAIGSDHGGYELKEDLKGLLAELKFDIQDFGTENGDSVDYPDIAKPLAETVASGKADAGILVCGTGIGVAMAANKVPGIRAANCHDQYTARMSREHNDANILTIGGRIIGKELAREIVKTWLSTAFAGGRHSRRVEKIMAIENYYCKR